ncbi:MAG: CPBP family intramembrane metalloprotease [Candidatus Chryseobacterium colombiense]|nr:CPBP family intramembrane glutamic endopeptidase [Chryseobacterium sp.]WEK69866.1 MAG: CPBP family intramembrane metalloprotease [Chryseobacterium sp.]
MKERKLLWSIIVFYAIAILFRFLAVKTNLFDFTDNEFIKILLRGIGPAIGALVAVKLFNIPLKLSLKGNYRSLFLPLLVFWIVPVVLIGTVSYIQQGQFPFVLLFTVLVYGLLEEIGWRGFLQEQLKDLPKFQSIIIIAVLWFIWHLNFEFTTSNIFFLGVLFLATWGIGKVYSKTYSLLAVAGFHSLNNFFRNGLHQTELILIVILLVIWIAFIIFYKSLEKTGK